MKKKDYVAMLKDPRWQKKRLKILQRDNFTCQRCGSTDKELQVHHLWYHTLRAPWELPDSSLVTLCSDCHDTITEENEEVYPNYRDLITITGQSGFTRGLLTVIFEKLSGYLLNGMPPVICDWVEHLIQTDERLNNPTNKCAWENFKKNKQSSKF